MKYALMCFVAGILTIILADYLVYVLPARQLHELREAHPDYVRISTLINQPTDVRNDPVATRNYNLGYLDHVNIPSYVKIIHDGRLGEEVIAEAPRDLLDHFSVKSGMGKLKVRLDRRFRIDSPVVLRMNLAEHAHRHLYVLPRKNELRDSTVFTGFETATPLQMELLTINDLVHPVQLDVEQLVIGAGVPRGLIAGKTERAELLSENANEERRSFPALQREEWFVTPVKE